MTPQKSMPRLRPVIRGVHFTFLGGSCRELKFRDSSLGIGRLPPQEFGFFQGEGDPLVHQAA